MCTYNSKYIKLTAITSRSHMIQQINSVFITIRKYKEIKLKHYKKMRQVCRCI